MMPTKSTRFRVRVNYQVLSQTDMKGSQKESNKYGSVRVGSKGQIDD